MWAPASRRLSATAFPIIRAVKLDDGFKISDGRLNRKSEGRNLYELIWMASVSRIPMLEDGNKTPKVRKNVRALVILMH